MPWYVEIACPSCCQRLNVVTFQAEEDARLLFDAWDEDCAEDADCCHVCDTVGEPVHVGPSPITGEATSC